MKITNITVANIIVFLVLFLIHYFGVKNIENQLGVILLVTGGVLDCAVLLILLSLLYDDDIEFEIEIPIPLSKTVENLKKKKQLAKDIQSIYIKMAEAENDAELDFLLKKMEKLKSA